MRVSEQLHDALVRTAREQNLTINDLVRSTLAVGCDRRQRVIAALGLHRFANDAEIAAALEPALRELTPIEQDAARSIKDVGAALSFAAGRAAKKPRGAGASKPPATGGSKPPSQRSAAVPNAWRSEVREHMASGPVRVTGATAQLRAATKADPLPTEFRLFTKGVNESTHGSVLFDARAAELVLDQAQRHGVDFIVDLEHYSVTGGGGENGCDARGWFRIALRNGELWAVNVSWTEDGAARLRERRQRYTSPAFYCAEFDDKLQLPRVTSLINVAICAQPATYQIQPLVASARR